MQSVNINVTNRRPRAWVDVLAAQARTTSRHGLKHSIKCIPPDKQYRDRRLSFCRAVIYPFPEKPPPHPPIPPEEIHRRREKSKNMHRRERSTEPAFQHGSCGSATHHVPLLTGKMTINPIAVGLAPTPTCAAQKMTREEKTTKKKHQKNISRVFLPPSLRPSLALPLT